MPDDDDIVASARAAYDRRDWRSARAAFRAADRQGDLATDDVYALANCSWWLGELDESLPVMERAYRLAVDERRPEVAGLVALDIGYTFALRGEEAQSSGWMRRAVRLLERLPDAVERGYLRHVDFEVEFSARNLDAAYEAATDVAALGERFGDETLTALGTLGRGRILVRRGVVDEGVTLLDEAMVAAVSDRLDPSWAGNIYCHLMLACHEIADLRRAGEWTEITARWCQGMPGAGPFMGICRVHRAQVMQVRGAWDQAERELEHVYDELSHFDLEVVAEAHYVHGDVRRLRGDLGGAEARYRAALRLGRDPQPGLALLHLDRGRAESAAASLRLALATADGDRLERAKFLPAVVDVAVARGDVGTAQEAVGELEEIAATYGTTGLAAVALSARSALLVAAEEHEAAMPVLRRALLTWQQLGAPYEAARVRLRTARVCEALGDPEAGRLHRDAAEADLARLGAGPAVGDAAGPRSDGLTAREAEVLAFVASGRSNQQIADELVLSVRTVERHLATVYQKLGLQGRNARAAAVAYALGGSGADPRSTPGHSAARPRT
jgi:DNA-binding CsgD family transcriptional regulator